MYRVKDSLFYLPSTVSAQLCVCSMRLVGSVAMTQAVSAPQTIPPISLAETLKQERDRLVKAAPWRNPSPFQKQQWKTWAVRVSSALRDPDENGEMADLRHLSFDGLDFDELADFSTMEFPSTVSFKNCSFKAGARFDGARFMKGLSFGPAPDPTDAPHTVSPSTRFFQKVSFANTVFEGPANFADTVFNASVTFDGASFYDAATFRNANLHHSASFERCSFMGEVDFAECAFAVKGHSTSRISFQDSKFKTRPTFDHAIFRGSFSRPIDVSFANVSFAAGADFHFAQFGDASNSGAVRVVNVIFDGISCLGTLLFSHARFRSPFQALAGQRLDGPVIFDEAQFDETATLSNAQLLSGRELALSCIGTRFCKDFDLSDAILEGGASFEAATFSGAAGFDHIVVKCNRPSVFSFHRATFCGLLNLEGATFGSSRADVATDFSFSTFGEASQIIANGARFEGVADFTSSRFGALCAFERVKFVGLMSFADATLARRLSFHVCDWQSHLNFANLRSADSVEFVAGKGQSSSVLGSCTFADAQCEGGFLSSGMTWNGGIEFRNAKFLRKVVFQRTNLGGVNLSGKDRQSTRFNFEHVRFLDGLELDDVAVAGLFIVRRPSGVLTFEVNETTVSGPLPVFDRVQIEDPEEVNRLKWVPSLESVKDLTAGAGSDEERREASNRLRKLAEYADVARDFANRERFISYAHELAPEAIYGSATMRLLTTLLLGRRRESVGRAAFFLILFSFLVFPLVYVMMHKHVAAAPPSQIGC